MKLIYFDNAATTPVDSRVLQAMLPYFTQIYANPSSVHEAGRKAQEAVETSRSKIAEILHCKPEEIIFTSGGTESINLAIKGIALQKRKGHIITSKIEHPAVLEVGHYLEEKGFSITYLNVDAFGFINPKKLETAIQKDTILISIMYANNEIGTIQPIIEIGKIARKHKIPFHTDTCQAGNLDLNIEKLNVDLLSLNGSKIYGPKGIGILFKRKGLQLKPLFHGGNQEFGLRSGTENIPGIVGFATALELVQKDKEKENKKLTELRDYFIKRILRNIPHTTLNGHPTQRIHNNTNISFQGIEAEALVQYLSQKGIYVSMGSACNSQEIEVSHVLKAIKAKNPLGAIRFSLGKDTTKKELEYVVKVLKEMVESLRKIR